MKKANAFANFLFFLMATIGVALLMPTMRSSIAETVTKIPANLTNSSIIILILNFFPVILVIFMLIVLIIISRT